MLRAQTRPVHKILLAEGAKNPRISELIDLARASNIPIERVSGNTLDQLTRNNKHQGVVAVVAVKSFLDEEELLAHLTPTSVLVILDEVEDPHNLGAIIRTAHCAGADAVVITKHRSAGLSEVVAKASAGAIEYLPVVRVTNLVSFFERLKEADVRVIGVDPAGGSTYNRYPYTRPLALVFGGEGKGLRRLTRERCDERLSIPLRGKIDSLNVSVAVGVVLFEVLRQREQRK
jgi:23S rRNA (guanosine2251-2'-O)-methyltransferase